MPSEAQNSISRIFDMPDKMNGMQAIHLWPVHAFAKLEATPNQLEISMSDSDF